MRRSLTQTLLVLLLAVAILPAYAQVAPSATRNSFSLSVGGEGSIFQPDYAGQGVAQTSPNRLIGIGAYADARFTRWIQLEAEGRWLHFNQYAGINENSYMIGPRLPIRDFHNWTPYGKVLFGFSTGSFLSGSAGTIAFGGGVDYRLTRKFKVRGDFEYQRWSVAPTLWPYGGSAGISYTIF
ncbi:MAG TPA: outer membrane beta-barrel protein [Terracidiphilus sp.]|nr:outer membrane beta-barrel protein [Terracidiphilus sp.]